MTSCKALHDPVAPPRSSLRTALGFLGAQGGDLLESALGSGVAGSGHEGGGNGNPWEGIYHSSSSSARHKNRSKTSEWRFPSPGARSRSIGMDSRCACVGVRGVAGPSEVDEQVEAMLDALVLETREQAVSGAVVGGDGVSKALRMDRGEERSRPSRAGDSANGTGLGLRGVKGDCSSSGRRSTSGPCWSFHIEKVSGGGGARPDARLVSV